MNKFNKGNRDMKQSIKIPVLHYTEITDLVQLNNIPLNDQCYLTNEGGKQYLVEVWA